MLMCHIDINKSITMYRVYVKKFVSSYYKYKDSLRDLLDIHKLCSAKVFSILLNINCNSKSNYNLNMVIFWLTKILPYRTYLNRLNVLL